MAKILVADDNSNIQRMVGLALKDQGIDVIAVGNGEAAVRKISDVRPDLVLADVFMPVRNGYEVCQYVKTSSSLSHIPVILLVGAFDPLDEQEAQRVGADGVLKKPFVPPDPLISMVKSALQRAGVPHGSAPAAKAPEHEGLRAADLLTPSSATLPTVAAFSVEPAHEEPIAAPEHESFVDEVQARPEPVRIDTGSQPVAFGSLLETPATEQEDDQVFASPADTEFTNRDWHAVDDEEETETEEDEENSESGWRREDAESHAETKPSRAARDWRAGGFEQIAREKSQGMGWEPEEEKPELVETAPAASNRAAETPAPTLSALPQEPAPIPPTPLGKDLWTSKPSPALQELSSVETSTAVEVVSHAPSEVALPAETSVSGTAEAAPAEPEKKETSSWFSTSSSPWDAELKKANQLASTWDAPTSTSAPATPSNGTAKTTEPLSEETKSVIEEAALPPAAVEAIREEAALVTENTAQAAEPAAAEKDFYAHEPIVEAEAAKPAAAPSMDDLVAKVLANMNPEVLQAVTREILKPVVEALVKEELKSKKP